MFEGRKRREVIAFNVLSGKPIQQLLTTLKE
jgi:hypothetical protein